jgi:hypothetical protein
VLILPANGTTPFQDPKQPAYRPPTSCFSEVHIY